MNPFLLDPQYYRQEPDASESYMLRALLQKEGEMVQKNSLVPKICDQKHFFRFMCIYVHVYVYINVCIYV